MQNLRNIQRLEILKNPLLVLKAKRIFHHVLVEILPLTSGSVDPNILAESGSKKPKCCGSGSQAQLYGQKYWRKPTFCLSVVWQFPILKQNTVKGIVSASSLNKSAEADFKESPKTFWQLMSTISAFSSSMLDSGTYIV